MKRILALVLAAVCLTACLVGCGEKKAEQKLIIVTDQGKNRLAVFDLNKAIQSDPFDENSNLLLQDPEWEWKADAEGFHTPDGVKYRSGGKVFSGDVVCFTCSGGYCGITAYPTGELLAYIQIPSWNNPHSIELMPDGLVAIAASTGGFVRLYDAAEGGDLEKHQIDNFNLEGAHGVLWDPKYNVLWAVGDNEIISFDLTNRKLEKKTSAKLVSASGHDLQPVYGDPESLWVTTGSNVCKYDKKQNKTIINFTGYRVFSSTTNVKGIGNFSDGTVVYVKMDGNEDIQTWNTMYLKVSTELNEKKNLYIFKTYEFPSAVYKMHVFYKEYQ